MFLKVHVTVSGYRAVVCGMDPVCCESNSWMEAAHIQKLERGSNQPFYQVISLLVVQYRYTMEFHGTFQ